MIDNTVRHISNLCNDNLPAQRHVLSGMDHLKPYGAIINRKVHVIVQYLFLTGALIAIKEISRAVMRME